MSNKEMNAFLKSGLPSGLKLSGTATAVHLILTHRYDTRPGKKSAYPGMDELRRVTNKSRSTIQDALKELLDAGLIVQKTKGRRGSRAEYVPVYALGLKDRVGISDSNYNVQESKVSRVPVISVASSEPQRPDLGELGSAIPDVLNTLNTLNTSKYVKKNHVVNFERWNFITSNINEGARKLINPAPNSEKLLDSCESKGHTWPAIRDHVGRINYATAGKVGGVFINALESLAGIRKSNESASMPPHCGSEYCDPATRTYPEASMIDGKLTNNCPKCHPLMQGKKDTDAVPERLNSIIKNFGKPLESD